MARLELTVPDSLLAAVARLSEALSARRDIASEAKIAYSEMEKLPPHAIVKVSRAIALELSLYTLNRESNPLLRLLRPGKTEAELLEENTSLGYVYLFHWNGRLREAALNSIKTPPTSEFLFAAIAYRLNDWAEPVRQAAENCARRIFPITDASLIAGAALFLFEQKQNWQRWTKEDRVLDLALSRSDVIDRLSYLLRTRTIGRLSMVLRLALRNGAIDRCLPELFRSAAQPAVRAVALQTLLEGRATWPEGFAHKWIDKSAGQRKRVTAYRHRALDAAVDLEALIAAGAADRSTTVRRVAADAMIRHRQALASTERFARIFACDKSRSVRERGEFALSAIARNDR